jgi:hypothetical protein
MEYFGTLSSRLDMSGRNRAVVREPAQPAAWLQVRIEESHAMYVRLFAFWKVADAEHPGLVCARAE